MPVRTILNIGDSLSEGSEPTAIGGFSIAEGGLGSWQELVAERLANLPGIGPLISSGIRGVWVGDGSVVFTIGNWTAVASTDAFDKLPYGTGSYSTAGTGATVTFTKPARYRAVVGFALYWVDGNRLSGTQMGNWAYKVNGGSATAMGQTIANDNGLKKFYVASPNATSVVVQAANAAGTAIGCFPVGIEWYYLSPTTADGLIWHNIAVNGQLLDDLVKVTSGDRMALIDAVTLGTGSPNSSRPNTAILLEHGRDISLNNATTFGTDLTTFDTRVHSYAPQLWWNHFELADPSEGPDGASPYVWSRQTAYRDKLKATATSLGVTVLDVYDALSSMGYGASSGTTITLTNSQNVALRAAGYLYALDNGHPIQAGWLDVARRIYQALVKLLGYTGTPAYAAKAKQTTVAYSGKQAAVAYSAAVPMAVLPV